MKAGKRRKAACPLKIQCRKTVRKETKTNLNLQRRNQTLVSSVSEEEGEMQWQRKGNRERRKRRGRGDRESGKQRLLASLSLSRSPNQLFSASDFTFSFLFHVDPLPPPAVPLPRAPALPHFLRQPATMQSAVTRATASAPAAARPSAGGAIAAAPRPSVSAAAHRRSVQTNAVKEVIMPALSSTMTEGKVRLFLSPGAVVGRRERGRHRGERAREGEFGSLFFFSTLLSLARFGPVASKPGRNEERACFAPLFFSLNECRISCFLLRNWSRSILSDALGEENKCEKNEAAAKRTSVFDQVVSPCRSPLVLSSGERALTAAQKKKRRALDLFPLLPLSFSPLFFFLTPSFSPSLNSSLSGRLVAEEARRQGHQGRGRRRRRVRQG